MMVNQFRLFCEYNKLINQRIYAASSELSGFEINEDKGAFFKSILGTLNHILVGDIIWLKRFAYHPSSKKVLSYISSIERPKSLGSIFHPEFDKLYLERKKIDSIICNWINELSENDLSDFIVYENIAGKRFEKLYASLISHLFLHQVHHRGQITTLLSQYDVNFGDTDLIEIIGNK